MKPRSPQNSGSLQRSFATVSQRLCFLAQRLSHELIKELQRLNSARMGGDELSQLAPRDRVRAVKAALGAHHRGSGRCC